MSSITRLALLGAVWLFAPGLAASDTTTIPKGTSIDLILQDSLSTRTAKVGNTFRTTVVPGLDIDDRQILPEGTVVFGKVELVKSTHKGSLSGVIGVKFTHIQLPGGKQQSLEGELTSWRQDDRKRLVELAPKLSTGRKIDTVFIGQSTAGRASTLVGDDLAEGYSDSGLGATDVALAAGTQITMEFAESLTVPTAALRTAANAKLRRIYVAHASVAAAQRALTGRNYYHGEIDGQLGSIYGPTRQALIRFQLEHDQLATGDLDAETLRLLDVKLAARP
jgi:hypothetical protein